MVLEQGLNIRNLTGKESYDPSPMFLMWKVISNYWDEYKRRVNDGEPAAVRWMISGSPPLLRRMLLSHVELVDVFSPYQ